MSSDPMARRRDRGAPAAPGSGQPSEEELRAAYEAELSRITSADMMLQAAVSLLNIGSYRLAAPRRPSSHGRRTGRCARPRAGARRDRRGQSAAGDPRATRSGRAASAAQRALAAADGICARDAGQRRTSRPPPRPLGRRGRAPPASSASEPGARPAGDGDPSGEGKPGPGPAESSGRLWVPGR